MQKIIKIFSEKFDNTNYRQAFFGALGAVAIGAGAGVVITSGLGFAGLAAAATLPTIISGATTGALLTSAFVGLTTLFLGPWIAMAGVFLGNRQGGEISGALDATLIAGAASLAVLAVTDGPRLMSERFPTPEQRVVKAANKAFTCKSASNDVQVTRNTQGEPTTVTVTCRR